MAQETDAQRFAQRARQLYGDAWRQALAEDAGLSYETVRSYAAGRRRVTPIIWRWLDKREQEAMFQ